MASPASLSGEGKNEIEVLTGFALTASSILRVSSTCTRRILAYGSGLNDLADSYLTGGFRSSTPPYVARSIGIALGRSIMTNMVEARISPMPASVAMLGLRCSTIHLISAATATCESPTMLTFAGGPEAKAFVKQSCPTVAATPTQSNRRMLLVEAG